MTRRIVFAGGTQAKALARAYRLDIAVDRDEDVFFIGADAVVREAAHRVIASADIVVTDVTEAGETVPERLVPANAERIAVPVVSGAFLWPYAGRAHPRNRGTDALPGGPYPADFGDGFLDSMLAERVPEDEALRRYLAFDVAGAVDLDALLDDTLSRQAQLDARTGFGLAAFIGANFRKLNLFATRDRLRLPLFQHVAATVLERMGVGAARAERLLEAPFAPGAMPIHPAVLAHFGMTAPLPEHRYPVLDEGLFTFDQYCRRYLRYEWNEKLHAAIALAESDPAAAVPALHAALEVSPGSRAGQQALEEAERVAAESTRLSPLALTASAPPPPAPPPVAAASQSLYAAADAPMPPAGLNPALTPHALPPAARPASPAASPEASPIASPEASPIASPEASPIASPEASVPAPAAAPVFAHSSLAGLHFPTALPAAAATPAPAQLTPEPLEQQSYVELPSSYNGKAEEAPPPLVAEASGRYVQLPPSFELIEVLPRMLPSSRGLSGSADSPFAAMPETMPPPPLRPVLPPELQSEPLRRGFMAKLFGR